MGWRLRILMSEALGSDAVRTTTKPQPVCDSSHCAPAAQQIDDQHYQCNYQQQVNETTSHVEAETQEPQN
jgi:hypothetical protein